MTQIQLPKLLSIWENNDNMQAKPPIKWRVIAIDVYNRVFIEPVNKPQQAVSFWDSPDFTDKFTQIDQ